MKLYIIQGEHPSVPGRTLSVHQDKDAARIEAISLINIILNGLDQPALPDTASFEDIDEVVKSLCDEGHSCDVWLEERELAGSAPAPVLHEDGRDLTDEERIAYWKGAYDRMAGRNAELSERLAALSAQPARADLSGGAKNQALHLTVNEPTERADDAIYIHDEDNNDIATFFHSEHATVGQSYETALRLARLLVEANNGVEARPAATPPSAAGSSGSGVTRDAAKALKEPA